MRRFLFAIALAASLASPSLTASATHLSPEEAYARCLPEMKGDRQNLPSAAPVGDSLKFRAVEGRAGEALLYIFDLGSSFCIASADDAALPLLAFGDGSLPATEDMPPALAEWLGMYAKEIEQASHTPATTPQEDNAPQRAAALPSVEKLIASTWNQTAPYYDKCPIYSGKVRCVTGCVATAVGQIMFRHKFPEHGTGVFTHSDDICGNNYSWTVDFGSTTYEWDKMTAKYSSKSSAAAKEAVATLMQHLGVAAKMDYDAGGLNQSAASLMNAAIGLIRNFGYSKGMRYELRSYYSAEEWRALLHSELSAGRPILYEGNSAGASGHAFVCDGYDSKSDKFHFNWGWGGNGDGYYALSALKPATTSGIGGGNYNYTENQAAILGIAPPQEADDFYYPLLRVYGGITAKKPVVQAGETAHLSVAGAERGAFYSYVPSEETCKFVTGLELRDPATSSTYLLQSGNRDELAYLSGMSTLDFKCDLSSIPEGDYAGRPVVKICDAEGNPAGDWEYVRVPETELSTLEVHVGKRYISLHNGNTSSPLLSAEIMASPEEANYTDEFFIEADVTCRYADYSGAITAVGYCDAIPPSMVLGQSEQLDIPAGTTRRVRIPCRLSARTADTFEVCLKYQGTAFADGPVIRVDNSVGSAEFTPDEDWQTVFSPGEKISVAGEFMAKDAPIQGYVGCRLLNSGNEICAETPQGVYVSLNPGESRKLRYNFEGLNEEGEYHPELFFGDQTLSIPQPIIIKEREFLVEADYPELLTEADYTMILNATLTLLSGAGYKGYLNYNIAGEGGFNSSDLAGRYLEVASGESSDISFSIWTHDLDFGDYLITLHLTDGLFGELGRAVGEPLPLRKLDTSGITPAEAGDAPSIAADSEGRIIIRNIAPGTPVAIFSPDGRLLRERIISDTAPVHVLDLHLPAGIYIVNGRKVAITRSY